MAKKNKKHTAAFKVAILKRHLVDGVSVSRLCEENGIAPSIFYKWQQVFFAQGDIIFDSPKRTKKMTSQLEEKILFLENKLTQKNEVLSELMEEHLRLKKNFGDV